MNMNLVLAALFSLFATTFGDDDGNVESQTDVESTDSAQENVRGSGKSIGFDFIPESLTTLLPTKEISPVQAISQLKGYKEIMDVMVEQDSSESSSQCLDDLRIYMDAQLSFFGAMLQECVNGSTNYENCTKDKQAKLLANIWVIYVSDSFGKFGSGVGEGNRLWWGTFSECRETVAAKMENVPRKFNWEYFLGTKKVSLEFLGLGADVDIDIQLGLCFPASCSAHDVKNLIKTVADPDHRSNESIFDEIVSRKDQTIFDHPDAIAAVAVCVAWLATLLLATAYDYFIIRALFSPEEATNEKVSENLQNQGIIKRLVVSFSILSNGEKILSTKKNPKTIGCLHGMRFLTMCWIILGHTYFFAFIGFVDNPLRLNFQITKDFTICTIVNATLSVDTFFLLSGFLMAYLWFIETGKQGGRNLKSCGHWGMFWLHRYLRLTPVYAVILFLYTALGGFLTRGPQWDQNHPDKGCVATWWVNLLYVNNFVGKGCMGHTWYLALDMQFYIFAPILLVLLFKYRKIGYGLAVFSLVLTMVLSGVFTALGDYRPNAWAGGQFTGNDKQYFGEIYIKPQYRWGPYVVGIVLGYIMSAEKRKRIKIPRALKYTLRFLTLGMNFVLVYGVYEYIGESKRMHPILNGFYSGTSRVLWSMNLGYIIFECITGNGGLIDKILSLPVWLPFSRLTYCAYLVHPAVMTLWHNGREVPFHFESHYGMVYVFIGHLALSYAVALVFSLAFEAPFLGLKKLLFGGIRHRDGKVNHHKLDVSNGVAVENESAVVEKATVTSATT